MGLPGVPLSDPFPGVQAQRPAHTPLFRVSAACAAEDLDRANLQAGKVETLRAISSGL